MMNSQWRQPSMKQIATTSPYLTETPVQIHQGEEEDTNVAPEGKSWGLVKEVLTPNEPTKISGKVSS